MSSLPNESNLESPACKTLAALADSLIWTKVSLTCHAEYPCRTRKRTIGNSTFCLLDAVKKADSSVRLAGRDICPTVQRFLKKIETQAYKANSVDHYNVIHHIICANRLIKAHRDETFKNSSNEVIRALSTWWEKRDVGVNAVAEALTAPYHGYARPCHYSNEIRLRNVNEGFDIIRQYYYCIEHVKLNIGQTSSIGKKKRFIKIISEIAENSRLQSVEITSLFTSELENRDGALTKILNKLLEKPPRQLIIDMRNTHSVEVVQILNKFPRNVTQLTIISDSGKMGAISELTANLTSLRISEIYHDVASIQPLVTPHKSLCRVFLELYCMMGELKLPDTVTHLTIVAQLYDLNLTISGNHLKSLVARDMIFSPIAFLVPELEYLSICMGMIHDIDDLRQSPYPKLKALECDNLSDGRNVIQLLELSKPSQSIALTQKNGNLRGIPWRNLLFSKYLPPVVTLQLDPNQILHLADLYFIQRLLGQPATSNVYVTIRYLDISNPPDLTDIAPKYRTLVSSSLKHDEGYFQDTYKLCPDFINACLSDT